jgi:nucleoside-diphosphate-sugar epimerase
MHHITITGGAGFLGVALARRLLAERNDLDELRLVDHVRPPEAAADVVADPRVEMVTGDLTDPDVLDRAIDRPGGTVFHLASVVSAGAEADFDLGYGVNLLGSLALLERCRSLAARGRGLNRLVFASSLATYGPSGGATVDDSTAQRPETSYGVQKACVELLINDYHRKGFVEGWALRLPTVTVRPGRPNQAASGFASAIIREPLAGVDTVCPVAPSTVMAVISPRRVVDALCQVLALEPGALGPDRTVLLPGLAMRVDEAVATVRAVAGDRPLGTVRFALDPDIQRIVDSWPPAIVSRQAERLGMGGDSSVAAIVRQHIEDELTG